MLGSNVSRIHVRSCTQRPSSSCMVRAAVGAAGSKTRQGVKAANRPCLQPLPHLRSYYNQTPGPSNVQQREVRTSAAAGAESLPAEPSPPQGLFWRKVSALALIFLGSTINYTILQVSCCGTLLSVDQCCSSWCKAGKQHMNIMSVWLT
jgi:hypothetical protein